MVTRRYLTLVGGKRTEVTPAGLALTQLRFAIPRAHAVGSAPMKHVVLSTLTHV